MDIGLALKPYTAVFVLLLLTACSTESPPPFRPVTGPVSAGFADRYRDCLFSATDRLAASPISADVMIATAEGECRELYVVYADAVRKELSAGATTSAEKQYAEDQGNARLNQLQTETRRILNDRIALQSLTGGSLKLNDLEPRR